MPIETAKTDTTDLTDAPHSLLVPSRLSPLAKPDSLTLIPAQPAAMQVMAGHHLRNWCLVQLVRKLQNLYAEHKYKVLSGAQGNER
jgi:hypothetical protein